MRTNRPWKDHEHTRRVLQASARLQCSIEDGRAIHAPLGPDKEAFSPVAELAVVVTASPSRNSQAAGLNLV